MSQKMKTRTLWTILKRIPARCMVKGIENTLKDGIYEMIFSLKYPDFKYLFAVDSENLLHDQPETGDFGVYVPTSYHHILQALNKLKSSLNTFEESIFIDIGSGAGRVLFVASEEGFPQVVGIEISKKVCELSNRNFKTYEIKGYKSFNCESKDVDFYKLIEDINMEKTSSIVFFLGGTSIDFEQLQELEKHDLYIVNVGPIRDKELFKKHGFDVLFEKISKPKKLSRTARNYLNLVGSYKHSHYKPHGWRIFYKSGNHAGLGADA